MEGDRFLRRCGEGRGQVRGHRLIVNRRPLSPLLDRTTQISVLETITRSSETWWALSPLPELRTQTPDPGAGVSSRNLS